MKNSDLHFRAIPNKIETAEYKNFTSLHNPTFARELVKKLRTAAQQQLIGNR